MTGFGVSRNGGGVPQLAVCLAAVLVAVAAYLSPGPAQAHAILVQSDPPVNARLTDAPTQVSAIFSESLDTRLSSMKVLDGSGNQVDTKELTFGPDPRQMTVPVSELEAGFYTVIWETLSNVDAHLLKGSFPFTVLNPDGSEPSGPRLAGREYAAYTGSGPNFLNVPTKWAGLIATAVLVGSLAFAVWVVRPASKQLLDEWKNASRRAARRNLMLVAWPSLAALVLVAGAELLVQAEQLGGFANLDVVLKTYWGERWIQRQLTLSGVIVALLISSWLWRRGRDRLSEAGLWVGLGGGIAYLLLVAMVSHGGAVAGSFWAVGADFAHLVGASLWVGMLAQLALFLVWTRRKVSVDAREDVEAEHLMAFSTIAATSVVILLASGAANALAQIPALDAMLDTAYGRALTVKLAVMGLLLSVAGVNGLYFRPRMVFGEADIPALRKWLLRLTVAEIGLAVTVLFVVTLLVQYPTSRQIRDSEQNVETSAEAVTGFEELQPAGDVTVDLTISPNRVGTNSFRVFLFPAAGGEIGEVQRVRLRFKPPDLTLGPSEVIADEIAPFQYKAVGAFLTQPGDWEVQVDLRRVAVDDVLAIFRPKVEGVAATAGRDQFAYPLVVGSWVAVGAIGAMLAALIVAVWAAQWPVLPEASPRFLRIGSMAAGLTGFLFLSGMILGLMPEGSGSGNPIAASADSIAMGRSLFMQNCTQCHGTTGHGDGELAGTLPVRPADMRQHIPYHSDKFFFLVMSNGLGTIMPSFAGQLTDDERWHILNFLRYEFGPDAQVSGQ